jgi:hypothetical protein
MTMTAPDDDREVQALIQQAGQIRSESQTLREAMLSFEDRLRRGLFRATVQGVVMVICAVIFAVSLLGYLTSKTWTCDPLSLNDKGFRYEVCDLAFPQTTQQARFFKANAAAGAATQQLVADLKAGLDVQAKQDAILNEINSRLNPATPNDASPTLKKVCAVLREVRPDSPELKGCP